MTDTFPQLDHIVVAAASLDAGRGFIRRNLHVDIPRGGAHVRMGTHNRVMRLGDTAYLEVIAVDPAAISPVHPRWFDLDSPWLQRLLVSGPRLLTWVIRVKDLASLDFDRALWGEPISMQRDGLDWLITVPQDGRLPGAGLLPTLLQWQCPPPFEAMEKTGCQLKKLIVHHPAPDWLRSRLEEIGAGHCATVLLARGLAGLELLIETPAGVVTLRQ